MKHIGTKLFAGFLCMAAVTVGLLWLIQAGIMKDNYLKERVQAVDKAVQQAAQQAAPEFSLLEEQLNVRLLLLGSDGAVQYVSQGMPMKGMLLRVCQSMDRPEANGEVLVLDGTMGSTQYALLGRPLPSGGTLYAVFSLSDVQEASRILLRQLWIITAVLLAGSILLAMLFARAFSRPVRQITDAARALAAGKLDTQVAVRSRDEIGQLADALNELGGQLQKTENLRRELIANVSHELRSPLAVIQGYAETVRDVTWPNPEKRSEQLTIVAGEAARLSRVVADILDYSKLQAGVDTLSPIVFGLCPAMGQLAERYGLHASVRGLRIHLDCADLRTLFDRDKFERVMDNLMSNAMNHADPGSDVEIKAEQAGKGCRVSVTNRGDTIAPDELDSIWDRYYRAQSVGEGRRLGTGLGLAIVKSILQQHRSAFGVTSENRVTTFWFEVPVAGDELQV